MAEKQKLKLLVRVADTDVDGSKNVNFALTKINGVSEPFAAAICAVTGVNKNQKMGALDDKSVQALDKAIRDPAAAGLPTWMFNRRKDFETGNDLHLTLGSLKYTQENDVKRLAKAKSYRGLRHQWGLTVRGQRTNSNFRKSKSRLAAAAKKGRRKVKSD